jgi:hypothetical protein
MRVQIEWSQHISLCGCADARSQRITTFVLGFNPALSPYF